jgi:hypothetical protein
MFIRIFKKNENRNNCVIVHCGNCVSLNVKLFKLVFYQTGAEITSTFTLVIPLLTISKDFAAA